MNHLANSISILGVNVHLLTIDQLHEVMEHFIETRAHELVLNVNINCLNLTFDHEWLTEFLNSANVVFCDGAGVMLGARILGSEIPQRITYADWLWDLAGLVEDRGYSLYFLGGRPGVAEKAAARLLQVYPSLNVVGTQHGYFDKNPSSRENRLVIDQINAVRPDILVVGFGMPLQEQWLRDNWHNIDSAIALTGGAVFDYISGELRRAPTWMANNGLEWLARLLIEPRRLWRRYILGNPLFLWRVLLQRLGILKF